MILAQFLFLANRPKIHKKYSFVPYSYHNNFETNSTTTMILPFLSTLIAPPLELKKKFSDGSPRFEFEWVISGQSFKIDLVLNQDLREKISDFQNLFRRVWVF